MVKKTSPKVVISIPAYNEERTLGKVLDEIHAVMKKTSYTYKVLVLNDGSADKTALVAKKHGALVVSNKRNSGLAVTFKREMEECLKLKADVIVHTDADGQYPASYIPKMISLVEKGHDLILGARFGKGNYSGSIMKRFGNIAFARVFSKLLKQKVHDTTTGFRAFNSDVAKLPLINSFTYTQEQLIRAGKSGFSVAEIMIQTRKTRQSRLFSNPLDYAIRAWINIFRIYRDYDPLAFFGKIGGTLIFLGFLLGLYITWSVLFIGNTGGIPRVILSMLLIVSGIQVLLFGLLADMVKK